MRRTLVVMTLALAAPLAAQAPPQGPPCAAAEHRQFDFWLGSWRVENPQNGAHQGDSQISRLHGGCVIHERWTGSGGSNGESWNIYDRARRVWHQTWVDNGGNLLLLEGGLVETSMVLSGPGAPAADGRPTINRITWTPMEAGRVQQHWQTSNDGGRTWQTLFLGVYRPRS